MWLAAGVSIATVSAALNDVGSARISAGTQQRVREAAASLGYVPNRLAQGLRVQRSGTIGFHRRHGGHHAICGLG